jgi:hypothetical protein
MRDDVGEQALGVLRALSRLPPHTGIVFHGLPEMPDVARPRQTLGLTATSRDPRIATENFSTPVIAAIISRTGRDITAHSVHPGEREVVLAGASFVEIAQVRSDDGPPVILIGQDGPYPPDPRLPGNLDELVATVVRLIRAAHAEGPVEITTPGKFTEPLYFDDRAPET